MITHIVSTLRSGNVFLGGANGSANRNQINSRLCETARHNVFANLRYKRPLDLLATREFQRNDARSGDLTPRACRDRR